MEVQDHFAEIEKEFFSDWSQFINAYIAGKIPLPETDGPVAGLPRVWRRNDPKKHLTTKPSLLFVDMPGNRLSFAKTILKDISKNDIGFYPVLGTTGCGKTRTAMDMLSQDWGFYFNGSRGDLGSADVDTLCKLVLGKIGENKQRGNYKIAKSMTSSLLLARLSILSYCLESSTGNMTPKEWMLLQTCPQIFGEVYWNNQQNMPATSNKDIFDDFFLRLEESLHDIVISPKILQRLVHDQFKSLKKVLEDKYNVDARFLLIMDEAQELVSTLPGKFNSAMKANQPIILPFYYGLQEVSAEPSNICVVFFGTDHRIYDFDETNRAVNASRSIVSAFPRWNDCAKFKSYLGKVYSYLGAKGFASSVSRLKILITDQAIEMLYARFFGRLRPMVAVIEDIIKRDVAGGWEESVEDLTATLTDTMFEIPGNLHFELKRVLERVDKEKNAEIKEIVLDALQRRMLGSGKFELDYAEIALVEASIARIVRRNGKEYTIIDEAIAFQAAMNFFEKDDPGFLQLLDQAFDDENNEDSQGFHLESISPAILIQTFHRNMLNPVLFKDDVHRSNTPAEFDNRIFSIAGCDTGLRGIHYTTMSMSQFLHAHCNSNSIHNNKLVPPFFYPKHQPSGPDVVFVLKSGFLSYPVFMRSRISESSNPIIAEVHAKISYEKVKAHLALAPLPQGLSTLDSFCSENIFLSLLLFPNYSQTSYANVVPSDVRVEGKTLRQYTMVIDKANMSKLASIRVTEAIRSS
ncbi:hypothetical protein BGZ49_009102 [Haplosporangium sp. Z 27]|nr:hypothetical protein BGZ49_009102 [Haplosporangium sp. Z 27]